MMSSRGLCLIILLTIVIVIQVDYSSGTNDSVCGTCQHGHCNNLVCICDACWTGTECNMKTNTGPKFTQHIFQFDIARPWKNMTDHVIGQLYATDSDESSSKCGELWFDIVREPSMFGISVDHRTGLIKSDQTNSGSILRMNITAIVRNMEPFDELNDTAVIQIIDSSGENDNKLLYHDYNKSDTVLRRVKRNTVKPPTEISFTMEKLTGGSGEDLCIGCPCSIKLTIKLPAGTNNPSIELFGPYKDDTPEGFVREPTVLRKGALLDRVEITPRTVASSNNEATHMALDIQPITVSNQEGNTEDDFAFELMYTTQLKPTVTPGVNLTAGAGALNKDILWIGMMNIKTVSRPLTELQMTDCPTAALNPGSIHKITYTLRADNPRGNYMFKIASATRSLSISDVVYVPGRGFSNSPVNQEKVIFDRSEISLTTTDLVEFKIKDAENIHANDASYTDEERSFKLEVYVQVSPFANSKAVLNFKAVEPSNSDITETCSFDVTRSPTGLTENPSITTSIQFDSSSINTGENLDATIDISFPAQSKQSYYLELLMATPYKSAFGSANVISAGSGLPNFQAGLPLLTDYSKPWANGAYTKARIYLGLVENQDSTTTNHNLKIRVTVKAMVGGGIKAGDSVSVQVKPCWSTGCGQEATGQFTIASETTLDQPKTVSKSPVLTIEKFQPALQHAKATSPTVLMITATFFEDFVYSPISFEMELTPTSVTIESANFQHAGNCLKDVVLAGVPLLIKGQTVSFSLVSLFAKCGSNPKDLDLKIRVVITNANVDPISASAELVVNGETVRQQLSITTDVYTQPGSLSQQLTPSLNILDINMGNVAFYGSKLNVILASLSIKPDASQSYGLTVDATASGADMQLCRPRLVHSDRLAGVLKFNPTINNGILNIPLGNVFYEALSESALSAGGDTLSYLLPIIGTGQAQSTVRLSIAVTHGTQKVERQQTLVLEQPPVQSSNAAMYVATRLETMDVNSMSFEESTSTVGPGEAARFVYDIHIRENKCAPYLIKVILSNDDGEWPVDLSTAFVQAYGSSIWCLEPWVTSRKQKGTGTLSLIEGLELDLGTVCSQGLEDSWIRVGFFARPWRKNPNAADSGQSVEKVVSISVAEDSVDQTASAMTKTFYVEPQKQSSEIKTYLSKDLTVTFRTGANLQAKPGVETELILDIEVPAGSLLPESSIRFECAKQQDDSEARCTFGKILLVSGFNLVELENEPVTVNLESTVTSGQMNVAVLTLGTVVNTAATQIAGANVPDANLLSAKVLVKLADDKEANVGNRVPISATVKMGSYNKKADTDITILRDGTEEMHISLETAVIENQKGELSFMAGETFKLVVSMTMQPTSNLECERKKVIVHKGTLFGDISIIEQNTNGSQFVELTSSPDPRLAQFTSGGFYFDQTATLKLSVTVQNSLKFPLHGRQFEALLTTELVCMAHARSSPAPSPGNMAGRPGRFLATSKIVLINTEEGPPCSVEINLQNSRDIRDCQITAFSSPDPNYHVSMIRMNGGRGWRSPARGGIFTHYRYVTVLFGSMTKVKEIQMKLLDPSNKVRKIGIYTTNDGRSYSLHEDGDLQYTNGVDVAYQLKNALNSRGIRIVLKQLENDDEPAVIAMDLEACIEENDKQTFDPCAVSPYTMAPYGGFLPSPFVAEPRTFLYANQKLFFCDLRPDISEYFAHKKRCYLVTDQTSSLIYDMGPMVSQILTYIPSTKTAFGIGPEGQSLVRSTDDGKSWEGITRKMYQNSVLQAADVINATVLPWITVSGKFDSKTKGKDCTLYNTGTWYICYDGIYAGANLLVDWNTKCSGLTPCLATA